jgi:methyl-accepting chemotaxis protein
MSASINTTARYSRSIRLPLIMVVSLAVLIPAAASTIFTAVVGSRTAEERAIGQLSAVSSFKTQQINLWLDDMQHNLSTMASDEELQGFILRVRPDSSFSILALDAATRIQNAFKQEIEQAQYFERLMVLDTTGALRVSSAFSLPELQATVNNTAPVVKPFSQQLGNRRATFSVPLHYQLRYMPQNQQVELVLVQPVIDSSGKTIALLAGYANMTRLNTIMTERAGLGTNGESYLVNANGVLMTPSIAPSDYPTGITQTHVRFPQQQSTDETRPAVEHLDNYRGTGVIRMIVPMSRIGAVFVAELDEAEAFAGINQSLIINTGIAILATIVALLVGIWFINRRIVTPLGRLTGAAAAISQGNLDVYVPAQSSDEFGVLANSFNTMTSHLRDLIHSERDAKQHLEHVVADYVRFVRRIASGDLTTRLELDAQYAQHGTTEDLYILGSNLNDMVEGLSEMAGQVRQAVETIVYTAAEIQSAAMQQNATILEQDTAVTQTVATVEEVRTTVKQTADRAQAVASASQQSVVVSRSGQQAVSDNSNGMQMIRRQVESIAETILLLSGHTQQIGEIINTVNTLADQSKLLALNASIEAARAGEEGRGFAVVAMEVRQLAEQSRAATARVRDILGEIQQATNTAVMVTEEGSKGAEQGIELVERTGNAIRELAATLEEAAQAATQIAVSTHQQTNGMDQLAAAMFQIKKASEQTASSTRQTELSIQNLIEMAQQLENAAARYQLAQDWETT